MNASALTLLLADARFPDGSHAHSGGVEQAVDQGVICDIAGLGDFLHGRLVTAGAVSAFASAAVSHQAASGGDLARLWSEADAEVSARLQSPTARTTSRRVGTALLRAGLAVVPGPIMSGLSQSAGDRAPHAAVVFGAVGAAGALSPLDIAMTVAYSSIAGPASAALRLLGLDPFAVARLIAGLGPTIDTIAGDAAVAATRPLPLLPAFGSPLLDLLTEEHNRREERLFAS
jgi:urease accessory protein